MRRPPLFWSVRTLRIAAMAAAWTEVAARKKQRHHLTADRAETLERAAKCRGLAGALRGAAADAAFAEGWEYVGVRPGPQDAAAGAAPAEAPATPSPAYEYRLLPVAGNRWGDAAILRRAAPAAPAPGDTPNWARPAGEYKRDGDSADGTGAPAVAGVPHESVRDRRQRGGVPEHH